MRLGTRVDRLLHTGCMHLRCAEAAAAYARHAGPKGLSPLALDLSRPPFWPPSKLWLTCLPYCKRSCISRKLLSITLLHPVPGTVCNYTGANVTADFSKVTLKSGQTKDITFKNVPVPAQPGVWVALAHFDLGARCEGAGGGPGCWGVLVRQWSGMLGAAAGRIAQRRRLIVARARRSAPADSDDVLRDAVTLCMA